MKSIFSKPVHIFLALIVICLFGTYILCDYNLRSVGRELMLNLVRSEIDLVKQGNLLTVFSKSQKLLLASDYVKAIKIIKVNDGKVTDRLHFGRDFEILRIPEIKNEITLERIGFLHSRAFYEIPREENMFLIFDIESSFLNFAFLGVAAFAILFIIGMFVVIRNIERLEFDKREKLTKHALSDFLTRDTPSEIIEKSFPTIHIWWKDKKEQMAMAQEIAIQNQQKITLGETASRLAHDILGPVRNAEILTKNIQWSNEKHRIMYKDSLDRIKSIAGDIRQSSRSKINDRSTEASKFSLVDAINMILSQKRIQIENRRNFQFLNLLDLQSLILNSGKIDFERSFANIINNAVEASKDNSKIIVKLYGDDEYVRVDVIDFGKGIESNMLSKIGTKNFSHDKEGGTGIGIFYARQFLENMGGSLKINSILNEGTTVNLNIPRYQFEDRHQIILEKNKKLLILEDELINQSVIRMKFKHENVSEHRFMIFSEPTELEQWLAANGEDFILYSDYYLKDKYGNELEKGLDVIERLGLESKSVLFTSAYEEQELQQKSQKMGILVLSKAQFYESKIVLDK